MTMKRVLVTGATGTIGPDLVQQLVECGWQVTTFNRSSPTPHLFHESVKHITGDITDVAAVAKAAREQDIVFHLAAMLHIENPDSTLDARYHEVNVVGTQTVALAARDADVRRFVYFSTVKVYGVQTYPPVDESTPPDPPTRYAQTKLEGEKAVQAVEGLDVVILRLSAVYGQRLQGSWARLAKAVSSGLFIPVGDLSNRRSLTCVTDVARAAILVAEHPNSSGRILNLVGDDAVTMHEILNAMYAAYGRQMPPLRVPAGLVMIGLRLLERLFAIAGRRLPLNPESVYQLVDDETYSGEALRSLGFERSISLSEGWKMALRTDES